MPSVNHSATINSDNQKNSSGDNKTLASVSQQRQSCVPSVVTDSIQIDALPHPDRRATTGTAYPRLIEALGRCSPEDVGDLGVARVPLDDDAGPRSARDCAFQPRIKRVLAVLDPIAAGRNRPDASPETVGAAGSSTGLLPWLDDNYGRVLLIGASYKL